MQGPEMEGSWEKIQFQFQILDKVVIDASSVIYMSKAGFFDSVADSLELYSPKKIIEETGYRHLNVRVLNVSERDLSPDQSLVQSALRLRWPVITDDLGIIRQLETKQIRFFNSLMMLELLYSRRLVNQEEHTRYLHRLLEQAWYSPGVVEFGKRVHRILEKHS